MRPLINKLAARRHTVVAALLDGGCGVFARGQEVAETREKR
jgi:hypothetical protein